MILITVINNKLAKLTISTNKYGSDDSDRETVERNIIHTINAN